MGGNINKSALMRFLKTSLMGSPRGVNLLLGMLFCLGCPLGIFTLLLVDGFDGVVVCTFWILLMSVTPSLRVFLFLPQKQGFSWDGLLLFMLGVLVLFPLALLLFFIVIVVNFYSPLSNEGSLNGGSFVYKLFKG